MSEASIFTCSLLNQTLVFHQTLRLENQSSVLCAASQRPWEVPSAQEPQQRGPSFCASVPLGVRALLSAGGVLGGSVPCPALLPMRPVTGPSVTDRL